MEMWGAVSELSRRALRLAGIISSAYCIIDEINTTEFCPAKDTLTRCLDGMRTESVSPELRVFIDDEIEKRQDTDDGRTALSDISRMTCEFNTDIEHVIHVERVLRNLHTYLSANF